MSNQKPAHTWGHAGKVEDILDRPATAERSLLEKIPPELLLIIYDFLPLEALACLALCNRRFGQQLFWTWQQIYEERTTWDRSFQSAEDWMRSSDSSSSDSSDSEYKPPGQARCRFLSILLADWPGTWLCHTCQRLHFVHSAIFHPALPPDRPLLANLLSGGYAPQPFAMIMNLPIIVNQVHKAAAQLRLGRLSDARKTMTEPQRRDLPKELSFWAFDIEPRLVQGQVVIRTQAWIANRVPNTLGVTSRIDPARWPLGLCGHTRARAPQRRHEHQIRCPGAAPGACTCGCWQNTCSGCTRPDGCLLCCHNGRHCCDGRWRCRKCPTEWEIVLVPMPNSMTAMVLTCWRNFGRGLSAEDPSWRAQALDHSSHPPFPIKYYYDLGWREDPNGLSEVAAAFENTPGPSPGLPLEELHEKLHAEAERAISQEGKTSCSLM